MRITYIELNNYKRIYNGTGLYTVQYTFDDDCNVVKIIGNNGSGKSSLLRFLTPFPDAPSEIIPNATGYKNIVVADGKDTYDIHYYYSEGKTSRASIVSSVTGELNPSGNIVSAKEIITNMFSLDPGFETLSLLTGYDKKSIAMMRPSERKAFISSLLQNLDAYTNIYKTLSKRSSIFKAMIQSLSSKINSIGSLKQIEETYKNLVNEIASLKASRDAFMMDLGKLNLSSDTMDKINDSEVRLKTLERTKSNLMELLEKLDNDYHDIINNNNQDLDLNLTQSYEVHNEVLSTYHAYHQSTKTEIDHSNTMLKMIKDQLDLLASKKRSLETDEVIRSLDKYVGSKDKVEEANKTIQMLIDEWTLFIDDMYNKVVESNMLYILQQLRTIKDKVSSKYEPREYRTSDICKKIINPNGTYDPIEVIETKHRLYDNFVNGKALTVTQHELDDIDYSIMYSKDIAIKKHIDDQVKDLIHPIVNITHLNPNTTIENIDLDQLFNWYDACVLYKKYKDYLDEYNSIVTMENRKKYAKIRDDIESIIQEMKDLNEKYKKEEEKITKNNQSLININKTMNDLVKCCNIVFEYENKVKELHVLNQEIDQLKLDISHYETYCNLFDNISFANNKINELEATAYRYKYSLDMLQDYAKEMAQYQENFKFTETLKKYCSPTTGIQLIFVELYMNKILTMANSLLSRLFNGEFILQKFVISDSEFRIPVQGNGLLIDDISSMSSSQIAMINMCISFAILAHSSTKYRIIRLDELDSPLDNYNRSKFSDVLEEVMRLLNSEQCFLISHNAELNDTDFYKIKIGR